MKLPVLILFLILPFLALAIRYEVGPGKTYAAINDVPWESITAGDTVMIFWRSQTEGGDYKEKWVINVQGTATQPFVVTGIAGPGGELPVINGNGASTRTQLSYWNEERSIIKVGGSSIPADGMPSHIVIENLEVRSGHNDFTFTDDNGTTQSYSFNAASILVEKVQGLTIRNCTIHDSGNGIFIASGSSDIIIEKNYIYGNGNVGRFLEHNTYTEANGITYQYNRFGPLRTGAGGNNLKDRSAAFVARYNWIEGGNRLLDLVDSGDNTILSQPSYHETFVYGNVLIEEDGGNNQVIHYGGDSGNLNNYRKGNLYFYHNTLYSIRSGNTTVVRLSSGDESADIRNNILFVTGNGSTLAILNDEGIATMKNNVIKPGWVNSHSGSFTGLIQDDGSSIETMDPRFTDASAYDFSLLDESVAIDAGTSLHASASGVFDVSQQYVLHQMGEARFDEGLPDIGAYFNNVTLAISLNGAFQAHHLNGVVYLRWKTASEDNISYFTIRKRKLQDPWMVVSTVAAQGSSEGEVSYNVEDHAGAAGTWQYRLLSTDQEGVEEELGMAFVKIRGDRSFILYPNPFHDLLYLKASDDADIEKGFILDMLGRQVMTFDQADFPLDFSMFDAGIYKVVIMETGGRKQISSIMKI